VGELVLAGQGQAFGQGVLQAGELQGPQDLDEIGSDLLARPGTCGGGRCHGVSSSSGSSCAVKVAAGSPPRISVNVAVLAVAGLP